MEMRETKGKKVQGQVPWIPTTPLKPILPKPVPIWIPGDRNQLVFQPNEVPASFKFSADKVKNTELRRRLEPQYAVHNNAKTHLQVSFDNIVCPSNGIAGLSAQPDAPSTHADATHGGLLEKQFVPTFNTLLDPTYTFLSHPYPSYEQPFFNAMHDKYQDLHATGTSYSAYYSMTSPDIASPTPNNAITAETRLDAAIQMNVGERDQREVKNVPANECKNPHNKLSDTVIEVDVASTPCKECHNHNKEIIHDIDLNKTPQPKPRRRKHRPKVIKEDKPQRTRQPVTPKPVHSKENPTGKRKYRRKELKETSTPQIEVTSEWPKPVTSESAKRTCRRSLNFDTAEQQGNGNFTCRENETAHFGRENGTAIEEAQAFDNCTSLQDTQPPAAYLTTGLGSQVVGPKRYHSSTMKHSDKNNINLIGAQYNAVQIYCMKNWVQFPNIQKKRRSEKGRRSNPSYASSMTARNNLQLATFPQIDAKSHSYASSPNFWTVGSAYNTVGGPVILTAHEKPQSFRYNLPFEQRTPTKRRSRITTRINDGTSLTSFRNCATKPAQTGKPQGSSGRQAFGAERPQTCMDALVEEMQAPLSKKKRTKKRNIPVSSAYSSTSAMQHHKFALNYSRPTHNSLDVACEEIWKGIPTMDALTEKLGQLNIKREAKQRAMQGHNALVPYCQQNQKKEGLNESGAIIPYKGPDVAVKKPRPKVDLDNETDRVWKLLMLDINSHGIDGMDEDKAKWWEEERNVFRGRADSFIARMHLVQGDRRFSQWKGSVVDSVVGVFLTQNVSDHLSSSAFMALAARFPLKSSSKYKTYHEESTSLILKEPQVHFVEPEENAKQDEKISSSMAVDIVEHFEEREAADSNDSCRNTACLISLTDESNYKLLESAQRHTREHSPMESGVISTVTGKWQENPCHGGVEKELNDVLSSQCSVVTSQISGDFSIDQNPEKIGSFSDSNSEVEDQSSTVKCNPFDNITSFSKLLEIASSKHSHEVNSQSSKSTENLRNAYGQSIGVKNSYLAENLEKSNVTQAPLEASRILCNENPLRMTPNSGVVVVHSYDPLKIEAPSSGSSKNTDENDKISSLLTTELDSQATIAHSQGELDFGDHNNDMRNENRMTDSAPVKSKRRRRVIARPQVCGNSNAKRKKIKKTNSAPVKSKKKEWLPRKGKKSHFDWDSLRKQALAKAGKREQTENTMDSLDWDAVRRADVNDIADIIKERGMNNMLAERIQSFLNLLVDDHGAIDLEWLRDVPPDQTKEYLLSIRGLGLKSVECVRLLTLHHLAFPVDTNVGRIAVRLGWVPLQPLPESLQLHLLELYPVLESIQKYLWPRLCKLDQRTLYELHYQMITFGKVFCTKSRPNCNSCPMRGECRHFASAFASARLALPGPEQKSIITTPGNNTTDQNPAVIFDPLPLPPLEHKNQAEEIQQTELVQRLEAKSEVNICQPIIEEPATPEPECSQVSENDIEDTVYAESCEIPTIKVDIEEFTVNLRNYMQKNMELQEGDVSKALVALHPDAARIPTPKLKNVSRLRTEHCVYELPDSHCLLEGWDKREPDDPGTYLLAIWTPGEMADSIQPPETKCTSQNCSQLCTEKECFSCNSYREANSQIVRGTILIPCRTAMRGSFPLNGTYFQVNEVFADYDSSVNPISVPRSWIWNLNRRTVYFGTSIPSIFKGLTMREIQQCFWRGYVCVRGFDRATGAPRPLVARLHFPPSKKPKDKDESKDNTKKKPRQQFPVGKKPRNKTKKRSKSAKSQGLNLTPEQAKLLSNIERLQASGEA